jgi:hypothetical protein
VDTPLEIEIPALLDPDGAPKPIVASFVKDDGNEESAIATLALTASVMDPPRKSLVERTRPVFKSVKVKLDVLNPLGLTKTNPLTLELPSVERVPRKSDRPPAVILLRTIACEPEVNSNV